ncbi:hypothetical protein BU25DRAFT_417696 [Macroventuria anomochaeta]|uniref:Uncharacterized protein n=1 Tax=Macroventuria anomochaeta TaxID=301207 RepID=A0ACB6SEJ9_9PLEO|nr:uncharacterized protein BU25DRAFT_417696 [Macroventuria anomochaeta]KAF2631917.1 hypothetical protein BU25DRAFT_417696 [Macroventuria anomochaeta]
MHMEVFITRPWYLGSSDTFKFTIILWYPAPSMSLYLITEKLFGFERVIHPYFNFSGTSYAPNQESLSFVWQGCRYMKDDSVTSDVRPSWEHMLVCCPAVQELKVITRRPSNKGYHNPERTLSAEEGTAGVTLGQVMQVVGEELVMAQDAMGIRA